MQQQITRGDYLEDLITIYIENNLQQSLDDLYSMFVFQCGEIQKQLTPSQIIKISFTEAESKLLTNYNTCYLAGITKDGHKETFNGSISFNTRGEVVYYEPTPNNSLQVSTTSTIACPCTGISGVFANCTQPAIKAYFSINYVPTKLSELTNDTDFQDGVQVSESISIHNASTEAHPYIQSAMASTTEALTVSIQAETTARIEAVSLAISTTEAYTDSVVSVGTEATKAYADSIVSTATTATEAYTDSVLQSATTAINTTIGDLSQLDTSVKSSVTNAINAEVSARQGADNNLQGQIDGLAAASDVTDIVGTYAELQAYDTQHLNDNDIIKVLSDSTHQDQPSYYRFDKETNTFSYIGSEDAGYTKAQANSIFVAKTTTVNNKALSSDITLDYSDVNALSDTYATTIANNTSAIAANTTAIASNTSVLAQHTSTLAEHTTAIATNTSDITGLKGLSNLSDTGNARLHALKAYADNGELLTDPEGLADVKNYAHSTFDRSKFTVVGSPNITDGGIASGFNGSNYINAITIPQATKSYKEYFKFTTPNTFSQTVTTYFLGASDGDHKGFLFSRDANSGKLRTQLGNGSTWVFERLTSLVLSTSTTYYGYVSWNGTTYEVFCGTSNSNLEKVLSVNNSTPPSTFIPRIGNTTQFSGARYWEGSIDLKQFSITVDGVEVFSGNKTGIDTIKPDDYTIRTYLVAYTYDTHTIYTNSLTVPTELYNADGSYYTGSDWAINGTAIEYNGNEASYDVNSNIVLVTNTPIDASIKPSADGSICTFNEISYLNTGFSSYSTADSWEFEFKDVTTADLTVGNHSYLFGSHYSVLFAVRNTYKGRLWISSNGTSWNVINGVESSFLFSDNEKYGIKVGFTGSKYYVSVSTDGEHYTEIITRDSTTKASAGTIYIGRWQSDATVATQGQWKGNVNLNAVKFYINGSLVYQPCLKIPYTESKTGSKIVNAIYRDRVNDMADQFGYANYYTLSDTDFTLPQVEQYGLIARQNFAPSSKYKELTLGASGDTYVAPADGYFFLNKAVNGSNQNCVMRNTVTEMASIGWHSGSSAYLRTALEVGKNDVVEITYTAGGTTNYFRFVYAKGSESEAN